jgi:hypothetical protein
MKNLLPVTKIISVTLLTFTMLTGQNNSGFAQCTTSTTLLTENFNGYTGTAQDQTAIQNYLSSRGQSSGAYTNVKGITDDADATTGGATAWKRNSSNCTTGGGGSCADCNNHTGATGAAGDKAYILDGSSAVPNGKVWCYTYSTAVSAGTSFNITAKYTSPWCESAPNNNPAMYYTVNGTVISASAAVVTQYNSGTVSYNTQSCYYTMPSAAASVEFCINMSQSDGGTYGVYNGQGNDLIIDDIVISTTTGGGCAAASGSCSYTGPVIPLPVELLFFTVDKISFGKSSVRWSSASEENTNYFLVEKSLDGINFYETGKVPAAGNSFSILNYEFEDRNFNQSCYYRLKMVDIDGSFTYSKIIFLPVNEGNHVWVINNAPNPEELEVKASVKEDVQWNITVHSILGVEYVNKEVQLSSGENSLLKRNGNAAKKELALCRITDSEGEVIFIGTLFW